MVLLISIGILAALASALFWTASQLLSKTIAPRLGNFKTALLVISSGVLPLLALFLFSPVLLSTNNLILSVVSGIPLAIGFILFYRSVETQHISNAAATSLIQPALLLLYATLVLGEVVDSMQVIGIAIVFGGVLLVSLTKHFKLNKKMIPAILGNVSWAAYWVFLSSAINSSNQIAEPLLVSRTVAVIVAVAALAFFISKEKSRAIAKVNYIPMAILLVLVIVEGIFDGSGNITFGIAVRMNLLGIAAVLIAIEPIVISFFAHFIYKENLTRLQAFGVVLATAGAAVIALL